MSIIPGMGEYGESHCSDNGEYDQETVPNHTPTSYRDAMKISCLPAIPCAVIGLITGGIAAGFSVHSRDLLMGLEYMIVGGLIGGTLPAIVVSSCYGIREAGKRLRMPEVLPTSLQPPSDLEEDAAQVNDQKTRGIGSSGY